MEEAIGYLIHDTGRIIQRAFDERARVVGGTHAQWRVLAEIRRHADIRQTALAELFDVEPITMTRMIDRLQEGGLVERRTDPQDRRAWLLHLTPNADPIIDCMRSVADGLHASMLADISEDELVSLRCTLNKIRENLSALTIED